MTDYDDQRYQSPCVGLCSTAFGDQVCRGCKRFAHEVDHWFSYPNEQKAAVLSRLGRIRRRLLDEHLEIVSLEQLKAALQRYSVIYNAGWEPCWWVFALMRQTLGRSPQPEECGLRFKVPMSMPALWEKLELELLEVSEQQYRDADSG